MLTFISHAQVVLPSRSAAFKTVLRRGDERVTLKPNQRISTSYVCMSQSSVGSNMNNNASNSDDDDENFGSGTTLGVRLPEMSDEDRKYLESSESDKDFVQRMMSLARRKDQTRLMENARLGKQTSDDYIASLGNVKMHRSEIKPPTSSSSSPVVIHADQEEIFSSGTVKEEKEEDNIDDIEKRIAELSKELTIAAQSDKVGIGSTTTKSDEDMSPETTITQAAELERVQRQIQEELGDRKPDISMLKEMRDEAEEKASKKSPGRESTPSPSALPPVETSDPTMVDRQIAFLEEHLEKLKRDSLADGDMEKLKNESDDDDDDDGESLEEAREKGLSKMRHLEKILTTMPGESTDDNDSVEEKSDVERKGGSGGGRFSGLENTPGEMSAEEKMAAFEALRRQAMQRQQQQDGSLGNEFADPYNVILPDKKEAGQERVNRFDDGDMTFDDEDGDVPRGVEEEYDAMGALSLDKKLLIEEIETEMKSYTQESRRLLRNHESRMDVLLTRLMAAVSQGAK